MSRKPSQRYGSECGPNQSPTRSDLTHLQAKVNVERSAAELKEALRVADAEIAKLKIYIAALESDPSRGGSATGASELQRQFQG